MTNDRRITRVGRFLRRYSLDELPQLINVIRGDMSLVGPRPPVAAEVDHYDVTHWMRLRVKPGMTGAWQVAGRCELSYDEMVRLDVDYWRAWSVRNELRILARTLPVVLAAAVRHDSLATEGNSWMKLALVGLGYWGSKVLRNMVTLLGPRGVVAVDASSALVDWAAASYPGLTCRATLEDALDDPEVVGVVVATPVASHSALTETALRAGRAVLVEKPLAGSVAEARQLAELADEVGQLLMVGHTFLFSPRLAVIRSYIDDGTLGPIHYATMSRFAARAVPQRRQRDLGPRAPRHLDPLLPARRVPHDRPDRPGAASPDRAHRTWRS